jgi:tetratricopeptide (TPR) repeat protein
MQLNLFQWDKLAVGKGYESLAGLDFNAARGHFAKVLKVMPDHLEAGRGLRDLEFWAGVLDDLAGQKLESAFSPFWDKIVEFPSINSASYRQLRLGLIRRLAAMMADRADFYRPPDLCLGYLFLQLDDYDAAESNLRILLERLPANGRLYSYLADAIWQQGRREIANTCYATALLLAPDQVNIAAMCNAQLVKIIQEHGAAAAPVRGFFAGFLPLVKQPVPSATLEGQIFELLRQAESARLLGQHDAMVVARSALKKRVPEFFSEYLEWLAG